MSFLSVSCCDAPNDSAVEISNKVRHLRSLEFRPRQFLTIERFIHRRAMPPNRRRHRDRRITLRRNGQVRCSRLLPSLFMTHRTVLGLEQTRSSVGISFLVEVSLCKKVGHQVAHVSRTKDWKFRSRSGMHDRSMVPHGSNVADQTVASWSLE